MIDISTFLPEEDISQEELQMNDCKNALFKLFNRGYMDTLQYTHYINFIKSKGSICNIKWFLAQIEGLKIDKPLNLRINKTNMIDLKTEKVMNANITPIIVTVTVKGAVKGAECKTQQNNINSNQNQKLEELTDLDPQCDQEQVIEFKKIIAKAFNHFFKYDESIKELRINKNICYNMTRTDTIDFTNEQKSALKKMYEFLMDENKRTFGLYGFAGSGKTTTVVEFVSYMLSNKYLKKVAFSAPTNKAVNVIKSKFKSHLKRISEKICNKSLEDAFNFDDELEILEQRGISIKFLTVHKLLMFQTDYSVSGDMIFVRDTKSGSMIPQFELCIIDECSMISMDMVDNIFEEIRHMMKGKTGCNGSKLIFTGDPAQLPPVKEVDSSIFCKTIEELPLQAYINAMSFRFSDTVMSNALSIMEDRHEILLNDLKKMDSVLLKTVVRSRIDNVTKVCLEFRNWIKSNELPNLEQFKDSSGVYFYDNNVMTEKIRSVWFKNFLESVKKGNSSIILTWTNPQTDIYNDTIRRHLFKGKKINKFEINDILMLSEFYGLDLGEQFVKQKLYTSEQIKVLSTKLCEIPISSFQMIANNGFKKMKNGIKLEEKIKLLVTGLNEMFCKDVKFLCWVMKVHKFGEDSEHNMTIMVIDDTDTDKYERLKSGSGTAIKNFAKQLMNQYRTAPKQIEKFIIKPLWKQWNKIFIDSFAHVNYGYSITCHKAQGSGFNDVYVDLDDILLNTQRQIEAKKCVYTAVTRTSNELHLLV